MTTNNSQVESQAYSDNAKATILGFLSRNILKKNKTLRDVSAFYRCCLDLNSRQQIIEFLYRDPVAARALTERLSITSPPAESLSILSHASLGFHVVQFLQQRPMLNDVGLDKSHFNDWTYYEYHTTQVHDVWHVLIDADVDLIGELKVWAFWIGQIPQDRGVFLSMIRLLLTGFFEMSSSQELISALDAICAGWRIGRQAKLVFGFPWHEHWSTPLAEVRSQLNINVAP